jgi:hypothetical protein
LVFIRLYSFYPISYFCLSSDDPLQRRILKLQATRGRKSGSVAGYVLWVIFFFFFVSGRIFFWTGARLGYPCLFIDQAHFLKIRISHQVGGLVALPGGGGGGGGGGADMGLIDPLPGEWAFSIRACRGGGLSVDFLFLLFISPGFGQEETSTPTQTHINYVYNNKFMEQSAHSS